MDKFGLSSLREERLRTDLIGWTLVTETGDARVRRPYVQRTVEMV